MADMAGGDYLYTFGFNFETAGLDQLLAAVESFTQRAAAGFGASFALPEGVSSPAATEGVVQVGTPGQVEAATQGIEAGLRQFVEELRAAGNLTAEEINRITSQIDASLATLRRGAGRYAQRAEPQGVLYGPGGEVLVHPQEQARLRLIEQARTMESARGRAEATTKGPIEKLYPSEERVSEFQYIVDPANREELNAAIKARAEQYLRERQFAALDQAEKQKEIGASEEARAAIADEALARRRTAARLKAEMLELTKEGGEYEPVRARETLNRLEEERQRRQNELFYYGQRGVPYQYGPELPGGGRPVTTDIEQDAKVRMAKERDRVSESLAFYAQRTDDDSEMLAAEKLAREEDALATKEHAVELRHQRDAAIEAARAQFVANVPPGKPIDVERMNADIGETYTSRMGQLQAEEEEQRAAMRRLKTSILAYSQQYEDDMVAISVDQKTLSADIKRGVEERLAGDTAHTTVVAEGNELERTRLAQEAAQTEQQLAANEDYIKATGEAAVAREKLAILTQQAEAAERENMKNDPRGGFDVLHARGVQAARSRVDEAEASYVELTTLLTTGAAKDFAEERVARQRLTGEIEAETLGRRQDTAIGRNARNKEVENRATAERLAREDEQRLMAERRMIRPTAAGRPTTDIADEAALQLAREEEKRAIELQRYDQLTKADLQAIAKVANAREEERLAIEAHAQLLREESDRDIRQKRSAARAEGRAYEGPLPYTEQRAQVAATRESEGAEIEYRKQQQLARDLGYQAAREEATVLQRKTNAIMEEQIQESLGADREYIEARANAATTVKQRTAEEQRITEALLAASDEYIKATASAAVSRQQQQARIAEEEQALRKQSGFDFAGATARQNIAKQLERAEAQLAESEIRQRLPAAERISLVTGGAGAAADRKILDAQINAQLQETLRDSTQYKDATAKAAAERKLLAAELEVETVDAMEARAAREGKTAADILSAGTVKRQALEEETKLKVLQEQLRVEREKLAAGEESLSAQRLLTQKQLQIAQREGAQLAFQRAGFGDTGTRFQRAQAQIDISRTGQLRDPREYQTLGAFFGQRAMNTFGYLTSGIAFYGLFDQFKQALTEATNVQRELTILQATFKQTDQAGKFTETKDALLDIASTTGRLGSETVNVFRQLYGAFQENIPAALTATSQSLKFAQVTGLDPKEINDSITAIALSFNTMDVTPFLDQAIKLEQVFGVLPQETIQFAADLAPLAQQMGFTATQLEAFGAAAQAVSGKTGGALAEQLGRVFEVFTDPTKITNIEAVFSKELPGALDQFVTSMATGNVEGSFEVILKNLDELDRTAPGKAKNIRDALVNLAGGPRQAGALSAILNQPGRVYEALTGQTGDATGALQSRFEELQTSLQQVFEQIRRGIEQLMQAIIQSGLGDALVNIGNELRKIIETATVFLNVFTKINDLFHGIPGQVLAVIAVVKVLATAMNTVQRLGILEAVIGPAAAGRLPGAAQRPSARAAAGAAPTAGGQARQVVGQVGATVAAGETAGGIRGALTAAGGVRGLATAAGRSAAVSAIGETLASAAIPIAGTLALMVVSNIVDHVKEVDAKAKEATAKLDETVADQVRKGVDPQQILKDAQAQNEAVSPDWSIKVLDTRFGEWEPSFTPPSWLGGKPSAQSQALTEIRKANAGRQQKELEVVVRNMNDEQRRDFVQQLARDKPGEFDVSKMTAPGGLEDLIAGFKQHPEDAFKNDAVARLIDYGRGHLPPEAQAELQRIADQFKADAETAGRQQLEDTGTLDTDIQTATERLKAGIGSTPEVQKAFDEKIKLLQATLDKTIDPRLRDALQLQIAQYTKQRSDVIAQYVKEQEDRFDKLQTAAHGAVPPELKRTRLLEHARDPTIDVSTRYDNYVEYIQNQQDELQKRADLARTAAAKLRILQEGMPIPPEVQAGVQAAGIGTNYQEYAAALGKNATDFGTTVQEQSKELGVDQQTVVKALIDARIKALEAIPQSIISNEAQQELERLKALRIKLETAPPPETPDPGTTATASPEQIWQAAIDANKEKAQKLQALQDLRSAQLRDPIQTAKDNIEKARIAKDQADPESVEFIQAQIDEQNAINELADAQEDITQAFYTLAASRTRDPLEKARIGVQAAQAAVDAAHGDAEKMRAQAQLNDAINQVDDANKEIVQALYDLAATQTRDPIQKAKYALDAAIYIRDHANGTAEWLRAQAQVNQAIQAVEDAENDVVQALYELAQAQTTNPVLAAQYAAAAAAAAVANAHDTASQLRAQAQKIQADRAVQQAIYDVANSNVELLEAIANAAGDTVGAANTALTLARQKFDQVMASTPDDAAAVNRARADVVAAERTSYDAILTSKQDDIQFALDMKQITKQQAIEMLTSLLTIPTNTQAQNRAIRRQIEQLKSELSQDFQFNLPSILGLPTLYEARRLGQGMGQGLGGYQDNRQISVQVFANTNADPNQIAAAVADVLGPPQTFGVAGRRY